MDLPFEVLVHLFKYIPKSDRKAASETCRSWYSAANAPCFLDKKIVVFYRSVLSDERTSPSQIFLNSATDYCNYLFNEVEISYKLNEFWDCIGDNVRMLTLQNCDLCEKVFLHILEKCSYLQQLEIQSCRELFMSGRLLEGKTDGFAVDSLSNLKLLSLSGNQYLTDALFNRFISAAPKLQELNLSGCSLQFHMGLVKKFYPVNVDISLNPSESVLTFYFVLQSIVSKAKFMKRLSFSNTLIDGAALKSLSEVPELKLETLEVFCCDQLTYHGILALTSYQTSLKELNIGMCSRVADQSIVHICKNLINLEVLNLQRCRGITDLGITELKKLKKLRSLNISQCELITIEGLQKGICSVVNEVLQDLDIHSLNINEIGLIMISNTLPNLRSLDISFCFNAVTDYSIQEIFKNQIWLHTLKMSHCDRLSDGGLTGMGKLETKGEEDYKGLAMSNNDDSNSHVRIHLGSRAEEEIMRDAKRKRDVMRLCEKLSTDSYSGYSLERLKELRELDISGCNRITDVSLTYAFNFSELFILNMSRCQQVTHKGLEYLVKNCPSIEYFNLVDCYNLDDVAVTKIVQNLKRLKQLELKVCQQVTHEGLEYLVKNCPSIEYFNLVDCYNLDDVAVTKIVQNLKRLKQLELKGCNKLTDTSLEAVRDHCEKLRYLDVQGCRNISPELACTIGRLPTLHTVLISKPGPYITDGLKNRSPAPTFLPALMRKLLLRRRND